MKTDSLRPTCPHPVSSGPTPIGSSTCMTHPSRYPLHPFGPCGPQHQIILPIPSTGTDRGRNQAGVPRTSLFGALVRPCGWSFLGPCALHSQPPGSGVWEEFTGGSPAEGRSRLSGFPHGCCSPMMALGHCPPTTTGDPMDVCFGAPGATPIRVGQTGAERLHLAWDLMVPWT